MIFFNLEKIVKIDIIWLNFTTTVSSIEFTVWEVHFWMSFHKLFKFFLLCQLVWCWESCLFLPHVKHHLLNCGSCLSVQIWQFWWFRVYFLCVNLFVSFNWSAPPTCLIFPLLNCNIYIFSFVVLNLAFLNCPQRVIRVDFTFKFSIDNSLSIHINFQCIKSNCDFNLFFCNLFANKDVHIQGLR